MQICLMVFHLELHLVAPIVVRAHVRALATMVAGEVKGLAVVPTNNVFELGGATLPLLINLFLQWLINHLRLAIFILQQT